MNGEFWQTFVLIGFAGLGIGFGLVLGAFTARMLRRYMRSELKVENGRDDDEKRDRLHGV